MTAGPGLKTGLLWFIGRREQSDDSLDAYPAVPFSAWPCLCYATADVTAFCRICPH